MISYKYVVSDKQGLHATNAMSLCRAASDYESSITLKGERKSADCKNVLALMSLGARQGECWSYWWRDRTKIRRPVFCRD